MATLTKTKTRFVSFKEASNQTKEIVEKLQAEIISTKKSDKFQDYLKFLSTQTAYSINNTLLIWVQGGNIVRGGKAWKKINRDVIDWNKKIFIFAPKIKEVEKLNEYLQPIKDENGQIVKESRLIGFQEIFVFDISNTKGDPLPVNPLKDTWELSETVKGQKLWSKFLKAMDKKGIVIEFLKDGNTSLKGSTNGKKININENLSDHDKFLTGIHEYTHYLNHFNDDRSTLTKEVKELQAESVSYVIAKKYGLKSNSIEYCALYHKEHDLLDSFKVIVKTIKEINDFM